MGGDMDMMAVQKRREEYERQMQSASKESDKKRMIALLVEAAEWEAQEGEMQRARSNWGRALEQGDYRQPPVWMGYAAMERKQGNLQEEREVWEKATCLRPDVPLFWLMYASFEESVAKNVSAARSVFARWLAMREPPAFAWDAYATFEHRQAACLARRYLHFGESSL